MSKPIKKQIRGKSNSSVVQLGPLWLCVQENVRVHVEAGEQGAGGTLSYVDTVISMCISSHTLVCSSAHSSRVNVQGVGRGKKGCCSTRLAVLSSFKSLFRSRKYSLNQS